MSPGEIVTLDCRKLSGKGIVVGDNFRVPPLDKAPACFGSNPACQVSFLGICHVKMISSLWALCG